MRVGFGDCAGWMVTVGLRLRIWFGDCAGWMVTVGLCLRVWFGDCAGWMVATFAAWSVNRSSVHPASFFKY